VWRSPSADSAEKPRRKRPSPVTVTRATGGEPRRSGEPVPKVSTRSPSPVGIAVKLAGVASIGALSLLLNPFFIGSVVAVAALVGGPRFQEQRSRSERHSAQRVLTS
jgi:hypothetical protein